jgi:hypothetical protein
MNGVTKRVPNWESRQGREIPESWIPDISCDPLIAIDDGKPIDDFSPLPQLAQEKMLDKTPKAIT